MEFNGVLQGVSKDFQTNHYNITFRMDEGNIADTDSIHNMTLKITAEKYREKHSRNANNLFWHCVSQIAKAKKEDKWNVYLDMLKHYGKFTYVCVKPNVVEAVKKQWRECEEIGNVTINGQEAVQLLCYFGSSTYTTSEFATLLDGVINEMEGMGLQTPIQEELERSLEEWNRYSNQKKDVSYAAEK